jgi:hypothetical protein
MINIDDFTYDVEYQSFSIASLYKKIKNKKIDVETTKHTYDNITIFEPEKFSITVMHSFKLLEKINVYKTSPYYEDQIFLVKWHTNDKRFYDKYNKIAETNFDIKNICCVFVSRFIAFPTMLALAVLMKYNPDIPAILNSIDPKTYKGIYSVFSYEITFDPKITKDNTFKTNITYTRKHQ